MHRVVGECQSSEIRLGERQRVLEIWLDEVDLPDRAPPVLGERLGWGQRRRQPVGHPGQGGRAVRGDELDAVVRRRIVARGHLQRAGEPPLEDRPRDDRRRGVPAGEADVEAVGTEDAGEFLRGRPRARPRVVADGDRRVLALRAQVVGGGLADGPDPWFGELLDRRPPAVGAELDVHTGRSMSGRKKTVDARPGV